MNILVYFLAIGFLSGFLYASNFTTWIIWTIFSVVMAAINYINVKKEGIFEWSEKSAPLKLTILASVLLYVDVCYDRYYKTWNVEIPYMIWCLFLIIFLTVQIPLTSKIRYEKLKKFSEELLSYFK